MMATLAVVAPPSPQAEKRNVIARVKALRGKPAGGRSAAETKELIDTLVTLLPTEVKSQV